MTTRHSTARGRDVSFYTAVPDGFGDGHGLPVCLVLHGASATADSFVGFGFGQFLTDAVRRGAAPFVLAGATGRPDGWAPAVGGDYPLGMVHDEVPGWCADLGFDTSRLAAADRLDGTSIGLWCGDSDGFYDAVRAFDKRLDPPAAVATFAKGAHTRGYWNRVTPAAFDFIAASLTAA